MMWWLMENHETPEKAEAWRARFEVPPIGYTGSLKGTAWDEDEMLAGYDQTIGVK